MLFSKILLIALVLVNNVLDNHVSAALNVRKRPNIPPPPHPSSAFNVRKRPNILGLPPSSASNVRNSTSNSGSLTSECYIQVQVDFGKPHQPLVLVNKNGKKDFAYPAANSKTIVIQNSGQIEIYCPGGNVLQNKTLTGTDSIHLTCASGILQHNNVPVHFKLITCSREASRVISKYDNRPTNHYENFQIGYDYRSNFIPLIRGYFNESTQSTEYTTHIISKAILGRQLCERSSWAKGPFFKGIDIDVAYKRDVQRVAINWQIKLRNDSTKYVPKTGEHYLSRGHLTPKGDFVYGSQQSATFYFANAIPQWQMCNNRNWKILESNIQTVAATRGKDLRIYTGTFRIMKLRDEMDRSPTELYLYPDSGRNLVPIPEFIWKVVYDEDSRTGVGFVVLNNPYVNGSDYKIFNSICNELDYIHFNLTNDRCGYIYCCEVDSMRLVIPNIPPFRVDRLL